MNTRATLTKEQRDAAVAAMREFHNDTMNKVSKKKPYFFPKVPYMGNNQVRVVGLFRSELERMDEDVFIELINMNYEPLDEKRTLFRHRFNPHFREEYDKAPGQNNERFSIPVDELEEVWKLPDQKAKEISYTDNVEDNNLSQMTIRDLASILLRKPVSSKPWLNELVKSIG